MWFLYFIIIVVAYQIISAVIRAIKNVRINGKANIGRDITMQYHNNPSNAEQSILTVELQEQEIIESDDTVIQANGISKTKIQPKRGEKYYTPEDSIKETVITKDVESFNNEVVVQNIKQNELDRNNQKQCQPKE